MAAEALASMARPAPGPLHCPASGRVLICDDSPTIRAVITSMLRSLYECCAVESATDALAQLDVFQPDLVLTDVVMRGMSGLELCQQIRGEPRWAAIPIVVLTSDTGEGKRARGLEIGADDYLHKPARKRELLARVASLIKLRRTTQVLVARTAELEQANRRLSEANALVAYVERMATLGTLAAGLAHEINNPLAFLMPGVACLRSYVEVLGGGGAPAPAVLDEMRAIGAELEQGLARIGRVVADLRDFAADRDGEPVELSLRTEAERAWRMAQVHAVGSARLVAEVDRGFTVVASRSKLSHALLGVLLSAVRSAQGKPVTVRLDAQRTGDSVVVRVSDDGPALAASLRAEVFTPFAGGARAGLSVPQGILRAMGGSLEVAPQDGPGLTLLLRVPAPPRDAAA